MLGYKEEPLAKGYTLRLCNCCPYGYHIDLDFVRYCESIDKETSEPTGTIKGRRDRRRQRKSMEVLLGINPSNFTDNKNNIEDNRDAQTKLSLLLNNPVKNQGSFSNAISDFEKTLQRSKCKLSPYLPDVTAVTENFTKKSNDFNSPEAFKTIREQMVLSLERTKQLEKQILEVPHLKTKIIALENEKRKLELKLKEHLTSKKIEPIKKDAMVNCSILSRTVGVGTDLLETANASTLTNGVDIKWKKLEFIDNVYNLDDLIHKFKSKVQTASKESQTFSIKNTVHTQTVKEKLTDCSVQTDLMEKEPVTIKIETVEKKLPKLRTIASQCEHTTNCSKHTQCEIKSLSKSTQHQLKITEKSTQYEASNKTKHTSTSSLINMENISSQTESMNESYKAPITFIPSLSLSSDVIESPVKSDVKSVPELVMPEHKFTRQDTYTQICSPPSEVDDAKNVPSREFLGAVKVLNDNFLKNQSKLNQNAIDVIQLEWFKISSVKSAQPVMVEKYLDVLDGMSQHLLEYIVNMTDSSGNTAMHYAVSHVNFDIVSILLDSKVCDISKPNNAGYTSVMLASLTRIQNETHSCVIRRLFKMADVNKKANQNGQTALMLAVSHGQLDMVKMLLEAGADINIQDDDGSTALMCAAEHGHFEIVKHFLSQPDCDSSITDLDGSTALKIAMDAQHRPIGVLLYAHERNMQAAQTNKSKKKSKSYLPIPKHS